MLKKASHSFLHKAKKETNHNEGVQMNEYILSPAQTSYLPTARDVQKLLQTTYNRVYDIDDIKVCCLPCSMNRKVMLTESRRSEAAIYIMRNAS